MFSSGVAFTLPHAKGPHAGSPLQDSCSGIFAGDGFFQVLIGRVVLNQQKRLLVRVAVFQDELGAKRFAVVRHDGFHPWRDGLAFGQKFLWVFENVREDMANPGVMHRGLVLPFQPIFVSFAQARGFGGVAYRQELVRVRRGVRFINDTAATTPDATVAAFEAAVAGGVPIIKSLREGLAANRIEWIAGIINGTSNFILSEMRDKGASFDDVLKQAQKLGYAEADPTFDIEGVDAAHIATIMAAIAFGVPVQFDKAYVEGITKLEAQDIRYAEQLGYRIKLLGISKRTGNGIELRVHPCLVPAKRLIANVEGAMNAVMVQADAVGTTLYYGKGAGSEPTASAVIADLVDVTRLHTADPLNRVPHLAFQPETFDQAKDQLPVLAMDQVVTSYYLRLRVADQAGVLAQITGIFAQAAISIDAVLQREAGEGENQTDLIILTHDCVEAKMNQAISQMQQLSSVLAPITRIRKEELN